MNKDLLVLIIEDDEEACEELRKYIDQTEDIRLQGVTNNSKEALNLVRQGLPDAVILDLELRHGGGNGFFFLDGLKQLSLQYRPYILVTTNNSSVITLEQARTMGADFILAKYESEYSAQYVVEFLRMMCKVIRQNRTASSNTAPTRSAAERTRALTQRIHRELDLVGVSTKAIGYQYLTDAILLTFEMPQPNLSHKLSSKYHKTGASIERAMQNAINRAWHGCDPDEQLQYYTAHIRPDKGVPTLMEFISFYAQKMQAEFVEPDTTNTEQ